MLAAKESSPVESSGCKFHAALRETDRHCSRKLLLRKVAPSAYFGAPLYTYSLAQGIADGFLTKLRKAFMASVL
jgi:hypothetical protein